MNKFLTTLGLFSSTFCILAFAGSTSDPSAGPDTVLVEIDGQKLTMADFEKKAPSGLFHARNTFYEAEKKHLEELITQSLLERAAAKEHLTVEQLIEKHVNSTVAADPSDDALRVYYEGIENPPPFDQVKEQIIKNIRDKRIAKAKAAYLKSLRTEAKVNIMLTPPRANVSMKDTPLRGPVDAAVTIVEYADYECPYCQQSQPILDKIEKDFKGKIAFAYKDTPLPMHAHAQKAAEAALCAMDQGKYWEVHDMLYSTRQLDVAKLKEDARTLKLDVAAFDKCLDSGAKASIISANISEGQGYQLQGTPSFFVNGRFFSGGMSYDQFKAVIEEEIATAGKSSKATAQK